MNKGGWSFLGGASLREGLLPECVARVPVSLWGLGVEGVFARRCVYVRNRPQPSANRPQPFATVCNRSREGRMAVPMVSFAKGITLAYLRFAWQAWRFLALRRVL